MPRPFKVWSRDRVNRKSVVAASLKELEEKGKSKLMLDVDKPVLVVLEEDGTQVEDEDYFECLPENTVFILLQADETWLSRKKTEGVDVTDYVGSPSALAESREKELCLLLRDDFHTIATFSEDDLQLLIDMEKSDMSETLEKSTKFCEQLQDRCQQYLDDRSRASETAALIQIYHQAETSSVNSHKRQKTG